VSARSAFSLYPIRAALYKIRKISFSARLVISFSVYCTMLVKLEGVLGICASSEERGAAGLSVCPAEVDARPTGDRVRESLFAILRGPRRRRRVLDLFAGSGALGLEALSRGAAMGCSAILTAARSERSGKRYRGWARRRDAGEAIVSDFRQALRRFRREGRRVRHRASGSSLRPRYDAEAIRMLADGLMAGEGSSWRNVPAASRRRRRLPGGRFPTSGGMATRLLSFIRKEEKP
jgi:hypothetical protein